MNKPADGLFLGQFDTGRAAADSIFKFVVQDAGVFGLRTIWQEGGGGANIEWFTVKADGTKVLLNDSANAGLKPTALALLQTNRAHSPRQPRSRLAKS